MRKHLGATLLVAATLMTAPSIRADVWDVADVHDNDDGTDNGLSHGVEQMHDLGASGLVADQDWYVVPSFARSSYEVTVDNQTGDLDLDVLDLALLNQIGGNLAANTRLVDGLLKVAWDTGASDETFLVRVSGADCGAGCTTADQYRVRMRETTYSIPRFNNGAGQVTVVTIGSLAPFTCSTTLHFFDDTGVFLGSDFGFIGERGQRSVNTASLPFAAGRSGWIRLAHSCGYGMLSGKAVALELATGFTFDTPIVPRDI